LSLLLFNALCTAQWLQLETEAPQGHTELLQYNIAGFMSLGALYLFYAAVSANLSGLQILYFGESLEKHKQNILIIFKIHVLLSPQ
jgi:hypothetical protein